MAKMIVCPSCGNVFKSPIMDQKVMGFGFTVPYLGNVECPKCHKKAGRKSFKISTGTETTPPQNLNGGVEEPVADQVEESKFEDE